LRHLEDQLIVHGEEHCADGFFGQGRGDVDHRFFDDIGGAPYGGSPEENSCLAREMLDIL
jgi:hypothetical protein